MFDRNRHALTIFGSAVGSGVLGHLLVHGADAGLNVALVLLTLLVANAAVERLNADTQSRSGAPDGWLLVALGFAACFAWRDAEFLLVLDMLAIAAALGLRAVSQLRPAREGRVRDSVGAALSTALSFVGTPCVLLAELKDSPFVRDRALGRAGPVLFGLLLALPLVIFFGSLFASADPAFNEIASAFVRWNFDDLFEYVFVSGVLSVLTAGFLGAWHLKSRDPFAAFTPTAVVASPSAVSIGIAIGAMVLVFLVFVAIQLRYFFGGEQLVQSVAGLSYAEYARRGFFEMVVASTFALPVLYAADVGVGNAGAKALQSIRALGAVQLVLMAVVMVSATSRMVLYVRVYGLTEDRMLASAILLWLALTMLWFAVTVLRGRHERFTFGAIVSAFTVLAALNIANPHQWIASVNTARAAAGGKPVDGGYLSQLSADAALFLAVHLKELPAAVQCAVGNRLLADAVHYETEHDWRDWNYARSNAVAVVRPLKLIRLECAGSADTVRAN